MIAFLLVLAGVICLLLAGFGVAAGRVAFGWLGLGLLAAGVWLVPAITAAT